MTSPSTGLRRFAGPKPAVAQEAETPVTERCEFCSADIMAGHGHVVDQQARSLSCACRACYLLFTSEGAAQGRFRSIPDRYLRWDGANLSEADWDEFSIPVTPAFFFINSAIDRTVACYPSPAGATECELDLGAWARLSERNPLVRSLTPDVEAWYVTRTGADLESFVVPIDVCYALVAEVRLNWRGFDGGDEVRTILGRFRDDVAARSKPVKEDVKPWRS